MPAKKRQGSRGGASKKKPLAAKKSAATAPATRTKQPLAKSAVSKQKRRKRRLIQVGAVALVAVAIGAWVWSAVDARRARSRMESALESAGCTLDQRTDRDAGTGRNHRENVTYEVNPPAGGDHSPSPMGPGRYDATEAPDDRLVHSLEHGYVVVWHRPDADEDDLADLVELQRTYDRDVLLVERDDLDVPVAATAWHQRALCRDVDADALAGFIRFYRNKGPEKVPH